MRQHLFHLLLWLSFSICTYAESICDRHVQNLNLSKFNNAYITPTSTEVFLKFEKAISQNNISSTILNGALFNLSPDAIAKLSELNLDKFQNFYQQFAERIDPEKIAKSIKKNDNSFYPDIIRSEKKWLHLLKADTATLLIQKMSKVAKLSGSKNIGISLSSQFDFLLQEQAFTQYIDDIVEPMISSPTFIKNSKYYDSFPLVTRQRIKQQWQYEGKQTTDLVLDIGHRQDFSKIEHTTGTCEDMPTTFFEALMLKVDNLKSNQSILIKVGKIPLGLIKQIGDQTFLALQNVRNFQGELILLKGGVYGTSTSLANSNSSSTLNFKNSTKEDKEFHPLTYMRNIAKPFTEKEFKEFITDLDFMVKNWSPKVSKPRAKVAQYLLDWESTPDKIAHLKNVNDETLLKILIKRWEEIPNPEQFFPRLDSPSLRLVLDNNWKKIINPDQYLSKLSPEDHIEFLSSKWTDIQNPEQYLDSLEEYNLGKILSRLWYKIEDPEKYLDRIESPFIKDLILRNKDR
ncbi:MAG: hypothetical protein ACOYL6_11115 [Bacteriovoracaceae bacterium]